MSAHGKHVSSRRHRDRDAAARALQRRERARRGRRRAPARPRRGRDRGGDRARAGRPGPIRADRRGTAVRRRRRLRAHARTRSRPCSARRAGSETGRVIVVFGAGGDRDRGKRPADGQGRSRPRRPRDRHLGQPALGGSARDHPGRAAGRRASTSRSIPIGAARSPGRVALAGEGDVVVIAGKGHEQGQDVGGVVSPFDDREVAREALRGSS